MRTRRVLSGCVASLFTCVDVSYALASSSTRASTSTGASSSTQTQPYGNVLILDHLNINHEQGRHDWLKVFYFDFLKCAVDPRKAENLEHGRKTLWANIGAQQFHLPEGKPEAQVLEGQVTLTFPDLNLLKERCNDPTLQQTLEGSKFALKTDGDELVVSDPWGSAFRLVAGDDADVDTRGRQPGDDISEGLSMRDLTIHAPVGCNMEGIGRFYESVLGAPVLRVDKNSCVISMGPRQTLTFLVDPKGRSDVRHDDLRDDNVTPPEGYPTFLSNYGPHVSLYVADLPSSYQKAEELGIAYVNPRFKRRAFTLDQAIDDCMFRCIDIVDPEKPEDGPILKLEHEVRSVVTRDGTKYKSCPFDEIPPECSVRD